MSGLGVNQRLKAAINQAETVPVTERWRPVRREAGRGELLAKWRPRASGGARWDIVRVSDEDAAASGIGLRPTDSAKLESRAAAAVGESWVFGWICGRTIERQQMQRWQAGVWPADVDQGVRRQLEVLRRRLEFEGEEQHENEGEPRVLRLRRSIERVVAELYGLSVDELVSLERVRQEGSR